MNAVTRRSRNYFRKVIDRSTIHEERSKMLETQRIHLELSLQAALAKIRELEMALDVANKLIVVLTPAFVPGTDTITFAPATTQVVGTQTYEIWPTLPNGGRK